MPYGVTAGRRSGAGFRRFRVDRFRLAGSQGGRRSGGDGQSGVDPLAAGLRQGEALKQEHRSQHQRRRSDHRLFDHCELALIR
jgi:hypothetical protein